MNDERLKNSRPFGADYFDELLERIKTFPLRDWKEKLDAFLRFMGREVLQNAERYPRK